jgi:hypothetical protein
MKPPRPNRGEMMLSGPGVIAARPLGSCNVSTSERLAVYAKKATVEEGRIHSGLTSILREHHAVCHVERGAASGRNQKCLLKKQDVAPLQRSAVETSGHESGVS